MKAQTYGSTFDNKIKKCVQTKIQTNKRCPLPS